MTLAGSEELWFDPVAVFDSDCDEEFESIQEGMMFRDVTQTCLI